jgi:hypothetical protein
MLTLHVFHAVDGNTCLAHIAYHAGMVAVVTAMRRQIERHAHALSARCERLTIERIGVLGCRKPSVLPNRPGPHGIHRGLRAANEGLKARQRVGVWQSFEVGCGVERLDANAFGRDPIQCAHISIGGRLGSGLHPLRQVARCECCVRGRIGFLVGAHQGIVDRLKVCNYKFFIQKSLH